MTRMLVSVRDLDEALAAAEAGADFIDLKDPSAGALGGLAPARIEAICTALRRARPDSRISATIGDFDPSQQAAILRQVAAVAACGVDYVKVGVQAGAAGVALLARLADSGATVVPVLIADHGVDSVLVEAALAHEAFPALMLDTVDKRGGSLLQRVPAGALAAFVGAAQRHARLAGLAGALRAADLPQLLALGADFAGFRSAVCDGDRSGALNAARVRALRGQLARPGDAAA